MIVKVRSARIGGCDRALALHMFGVKDIEEKSEKIQKIYRDGEAIEAEILENLSNDGYKFTSGISYERKIKLDGFTVLVTGTPDAMLKLKKDTYPVEIKSMNPWRYNKFPARFIDWEDKLHLKYSFQMGTYLFITQKPWLYLILGEKKHGKVSDSKIIKVKPEELKNEEDIMERLSIGLGFHKGEEVLPSGFGNCNYCSFWDSSTPWITSACAQRYIKSPRSKIAKGDKQFIKRFKNTVKDIRQREEDLFEMRTLLSKYSKIVAIKYGKEVVDEYLANW